MKRRLSHTTVCLGLTAAWLVGIGGCSTTDVKPNPIPTVQPPEYVKVPHPAGYDLGDVQAIFQDPTAPKLDDERTCDADFLKLKERVRTQDELLRGVSELVKRDPVFYHWCFYGKILELEAEIKKEEYVDERQKSVIKSYSFLSPVAKGFLKEYRDSRYLRWAIRHYRGLSEFVFFQRLNQTPQMTQELTEATNPFALWREPASSTSILEKYGLVQPSPSPGASTAPSPSPVAEAASQAVAPQPSPQVSPQAQADPLAGQERGPASEPDAGVAAAPAAPPPPIEVPNTPPPPPPSDKP